jgi:DNA-binding NtrC family response regulator
MRCRRPVLNNKLEALRILATSILTELSTLKGERKVAVRKNVDLVGEVQRFEEDLIRSALTRTGGRQRKAAALLGIKPTTLHAKMKRYGMTDDVDEEGDDIYETS